MTSPTTMTTTAPTARPATSPAAVVAHHAVAGSAVVVPWLVLVPLGQGRGVPPVLVLLAVVALVLPPVAVVLGRHRLLAEGVRSRAEAVHRLGLGRPTRRQVLTCGVPAVVVALLLPAAGLPVEAALQRAGWFAAWPSTGLPGAPGAGLLVVWAAVAVLLGPVVEEVLFRGLLQPLLPGGPWGRVLGGSALFAVYHLWQPASWATVWLATLPAAWVRERTGSTWLAVGVHVVVNGLALGLLLAGALRR